MADFTTWAKMVLPAWLAGPWAKRWAEVFGGFVEFLTDGANDAVLARLAKHAPDDALPFIGAERWTERGRLESLGAYRARLEGFWDQAQKWGTDLGIIGGLAGLPVSQDPADTFVESYHDGWTGYGASDHWSRFWLLLAAGHGFQADDFWGTAGTWGDGGTWGFLDVTTEDIQHLRRAVWRWKDSEGIPVRAFFLTSGEVWGPGAWNDPATIWGDATVTSVSLGHYWGDEELVPHSNLTWGAHGEPWGVKPEGIL